MLPFRVQLPSGCHIFEPYTSKESLNKKDLLDIIKNSVIPEIVQTQKTLIIINDAHRATPSYRILDVLSDIFPKDQIQEIAIATGTHSKPTDMELKRILKGLDKKLGAKILIHDSLAKNLIEVGKTSRGTRVRINPVLQEYRKILCINSVEPHYFAGFTGGIKSIIPGLAHRDTVESNHSWALHEKCGPALLEDNPVHLDLWEAGEIVKDHLSLDYYGIQMVNTADDIRFLSAGSLKDAFKKIAKYSRQVYCIKAENQYDVILSIVHPPLDRSLYQAQKGIENTRQILKDGGEMILYAQCYEGIGDQAFYDTLKRFNQVDGVLANITRENYRFGDHKAYKFASIAKDCTLSIVSELPENQVKKVFGKNLQIDMLETHLENLAKEGNRIAVVKDSGTLVVTN